MNEPPTNVPAGLPHDIRGLLPYQTPWWHYALAALLAVMLGALLVWGLWHLRLHWKRRTQVVPPIDPWAVLESRIQVLLPPGDFPRGPVQETYFFNLSLLLREAIELRTRVPATDLTLYELRSPLRRKLPFAPEEIESVLGFLERADMVKFASASSQREEALGDQNRVQKWISQLRPRVSSTQDGLPSDRIFQASAAQKGGEHASPGSSHEFGASSAAPSAPQGRDRHQGGPR